MKLVAAKLAMVLALLLVSASSPADRATAQLLSSGRVNDAITALANHDDSESFNLLSRAYYAMEQWDDAVKYGRRAVSLQPQAANYHLWLAREYGRKAGDSNPLVAASLARKARNEFELAVQLDPTDLEARRDLSRYYIEAPAIMGGGLDKARDQALQVDKQDAALSHAILAHIAAKQKRYGDAEAQLKQAIRTATSPADYWIQLAEFYRFSGRLQDMQQAVHDAVTQANKPAETYFDAATQLYLGDRDLAGAAQDLQKYLSSRELVESAPAFRAHYLLGQIYERMGRTSDAATEYRASLYLASSFEPANKALGRLH